MKIQTKNDEDEKVRRICEDIEKEFESWDYIKRNGCGDPYWADGVNMNLVRNHIINGYKKLDALQGTPVQLDMFGGGQGVDRTRRPVPPLVSDRYMANAEKIIRRAKALVKTVKNKDTARMKDILNEILRDHDDMRMPELRLLVRQYSE